jgi:hypothetical protein
MVPDEKRQLGKYRCMCEDNVKMDVTGTGLDGVD